MIDFNELIPEMRDWNDGAGVDVNAWVACMGSNQLAIGYSTIFWPRFVEFEHYVLREGFSIESLRSFESACDGDRGRIEGVMNHLHIGDIHCNGDLTCAQAVYLGRVLREIYHVKLAWQFPSKHFEVYFDDSVAEKIIDYQITFLQI